MNPSRSPLLTKIRENADFDVVVVGGGVNGVGVYRDLGLQGLRVLLVEMNDFCSGCSAAPSRMIHGGLRYLENGEFDLVRESLAERDALLLNAPHMVQPLPTIIPIGSLFSGLLNSASSFLGFKGKPSSRGLVPIKMGLSLYDWVTRKRRLMPRHSTFGRAATQKKWPVIAHNAKYSAIYHDAWISHPERLCMELLGDVAETSPESVALNYARFSRDGDAYAVTDSRSGKTLEINPKLIINATGAWLDTVAEDLGDKPRAKMVSGTKGSHLILDNKALHDALDGHMVYFENSDARVCIVFPYLGKVLAGSTDIRVDTPARVKCEPDELDYILTSLRMVFRGIDIGADDVVFSYAGIRPLPKSDADFTGRISRGHYTRVIDGGVPQLCMIGGKWTTFRAFAEQAADEALALLGQSRTNSTAERPIGGGQDFPGSAATLEASLTSTYAISGERATHLVSHYGTSARAVLDAVHGAPEDQRIAPSTEYTRAEIAFLAQNEAVETLSDIALRRTSLAIRGLIDSVVLDVLSEVVSEALQLRNEEARAQRQALIEELITYHGASTERLECQMQDRSIECA